MCATVLESGENVAVCAPTAAGKTVIFDLAIVRAMVLAPAGTPLNGKVVYLAPNKALCSERADDWCAKE